MPSSSTARPAKGARRTRQGASVSTKQIARTVKDGRLVCFVTQAIWQDASAVSSMEVRGYVAGMDDYHWVVVDPDACEIYLVHKSAPVIKISSTASYQDEARLDDLEKIIAPFRKHVLETYFGESANH